MSIKIWGAFNDRTEHESFHINIPSEPCYMLVHFHDPVELLLNGDTIITEPHACVIFPPDKPVDYKSLQGGFTNDYVKFTYDDERLLENSELPIYKIFYIEPSWKFIESISRITWWLTDVMIDHSREMADALRCVIDELCISRVDISPKAKRDNLTVQRLRQIRSEVISAPGEWSVERMAEAFFMTRSHFSVLYKKQFGVSPGEDIQRITMDLAASLLKESQMSVEEIGHKCGYSSSENFIRSFKKIFGITPLRYRHEAKE
ncbi:MAG: helix-turn-helix transcriptional regulator [Ruminococcus sp.]|uniref:helix-turn-helix transcriptional regulator n=1 Tax=Ruminococcus sp. TaxID=41978 RepID=UPI0025CEA657|nr:AraC family transcriptional regulator [Ruminococcus sp.]MBO4867128.1 helix-turn-helix transcriptional regulator [Ruminococcus sp.]